MCISLKAHTYLNDPENQIVKLDNEAGQEKGGEGWLPFYTYKEHALLWTWKNDFSLYLYHICFTLLRYKILGSFAHGGHRES